MSDIALFRVNVEQCLSIHLCRYISFNKFLKIICNSFAILIIQQPRSELRHPRSFQNTLSRHLTLTIPRNRNSKLEANLLSTRYLPKSLYRLPCISKRRSSVSCGTRSSHRHTRYRPSISREMGCWLTFPGIERSKESRERPLETHSPWLGDHHGHRPRTDRAWTSGGVVVGANRTRCSRPYIHAFMYEP